MAQLFHVLSFFLDVVWLSLSLILYYRVLATLILKSEIIISNVGVILFVKSNVVSYFSQFLNLVLGANAKMVCTWSKNLRCLIFDS